MISVHDKSKYCQMQGWPFLLKKNFEDKKAKPRAASRTCEGAKPNTLYVGSSILSTLKLSFMQ
jgi:hypothetical protein